MQLGSPTMFYFQEGGSGLEFGNVNSDYNNYRLSFTYMWLIIDFFIYIVLGIYLENILPQATGVRKPFYYFLKPSFWCPGLFKSRTKYAHVDIDEEEN